MKKIKLDPYDLRILINGLYSCRKTCPPDVREQIDSILFWLMETFEEMKSGRKKKLAFTTDEKRLVLLCLNEWRNSFLSGSNENKADAVAETMSKFIR